MVREMKAMVEYDNDHDKRQQQLIELCESGELDCMPMRLKSLLFELIEVIRFLDARVLELETKNENIWGNLSEAERNKIIRDAKHGV